MDIIDKGLILISLILALMVIGAIISSIYFSVQVNNGVFESNVSFCQTLEGKYLYSEASSGLCVVNDLTYQITEENGCNPQFFNFNCKHKLNGFANKGFI